MCAAISHFASYIVILKTLDNHEIACGLSQRRFNSASSHKKRYKQLGYTNKLRGLRFAGRQGSQFRAGERIFCGVAQLYWHCSIY